DAVNGIHEILHNELRLLRVRLMSFALFVAISGEYQDAGGSDTLSRFNIHVFVADNIRPVQVDLHIFLSSKQHARIGFTAVTAGVRMMGADIDGVQRRVVAGQFGFQDRVNFVYSAFVEVTTADPGLVCDQYRLHTTFIDLPDRGAGPGKRLIKARM